MCIGANLGKILGKRAPLPTP